MPSPVCVVSCPVCGSCVSRVAGGQSAARRGEAAHLIAADCPPSLPAQSSSAMSDLDSPRVGTPTASTSAISADAMLRERSPEPDEDMRMDEQPTAWLVKVPRFLYEGWSSLSQEDQQLGFVRVYE